METLRNVSSTIEAEGDLRIEAGTLRNEREVFEVGTVVTYALGSNYIETITTHVVKANSAQGLILSGNDMTLNVQSNLNNKYSTISAGGNLTTQGWNATSANQSYSANNTVLRVTRLSPLACSSPLMACIQSSRETFTTPVTLAQATFSANRNLTVEFGELKNGNQVGSMAQGHASAHQGPDRDTTLPNWNLGQDGYQLPSSALVKPSNSPN
ncbi:hypothetical protein P3G55_26105, partial [Leptospira sp. 96542]|nr:hypothetical protein [Leptospira sp. 96542]